MKKHKGVLIAIEGIDGCGKTTFTELLLSKIANRGLASKVRQVSTFHTCAEAKVARDVLVNPNSKTPVDELGALMTGIHALNYNQFCKPLMDDGFVVLLDRSIYSTIVYQLGGDTSKVPADIYPDYTVFLDVSVETAAIRRVARQDPTKDRIEAQADSIHEGYRQLYLDLAANADQGSAIVVNNDADVRTLEQLADDVAAQIVLRVN